MALNIPTGGSSQFSGVYSETSSISESFDAKTDARRVLVVHLHMDDNSDTPTFNTPTFNSVNLTLVSQGEHLYAGDARVVRHEIWKLKSPASGSNTLAVTTSATAQRVAVVAEVLADCDDFVSGKAATSGGNLDIYALPVTTSDANSWLVGGVGGANTRDWQMTTGTEIEAVTPSGNHRVIAGREDATGAADTFDVDTPTTGAVRSACACAEFSEDLGGGTTFEQSVAGSLTSAGELTHQVETAPAGALTSAGTVAHQVAQSATGTLTLAGAVGLVVQLVLVATLTTAGTVAALKLVALQLAGTLTTAGVLARRVARLLVGVATSSGALERQPQVSPVGSVTLTGVVSAIKLVTQAVVGTLSSSGAATQRPSRAVGGTLTTAGDVARRPAHSLTGALTLAGVLSPVKTALLTLAGTLTSSATLLAERVTGTVLLSLTGTLTTAGVAAHQVARTLGGTTPTAGTATQQAQRAAAGTLSSSGTVATVRTRLLTLAGLLTTAGTLGQRAGLALGGTVAPAGSVRHRVEQLVAGTLTVAGTVTATLVNTVIQLVQWLSLAVRVPELTDEGLTTPGLTDETFTSPGFTDETWETTDEDPE